MEVSEIFSLFVHSIVGDNLRHKKILLQFSAKPIKSKLQNFELKVRSQEAELTSYSICILSRGGQSYKAWLCCRAFHYEIKMHPSVNDHGLMDIQRYVEVLCGLISLKHICLGTAWPN